MKKEQNLQEPQEQVLNIPVVSKRKYWYKDSVDVCVLCGKETRNRKRVYNKKEKGTEWSETACWGHF